MKRSSHRIVPQFQLPKSSDFEATVRIYSQAERLVAEGEYSRALPILQEALNRFTSLSCSGELKHSLHLFDWSGKCLGLAAKCHRRLNHPEFAAKLESASRTPTGGTAEKGNIPAQLLAGKLDHAVMCFNRAALGWEGTGERSAILADLQEAEAEFQELCELCPHSTFYPQLLSACVAAIGWVSDPLLPRRAVNSPVAASNDGKFSGVASLKSLANQYSPRYERERAIAKSENATLNLVRGGFDFAGRKLVNSILPMAAVILLLTLLAKMHWIAGVFGPIACPLLSFVLATTSWLWLSNKKHRPLMGCAAFALNLPWLYGICHMPPMLAVPVCVGYVVSMLLGVCWACRLDVWLQRLPIAYRIVSHLARLNRQADDLSVGWAYWIRHHLPGAMAALLTEVPEGADKPRLRTCFDWMPLTFIHVKEAPVTLSLLGLLFYDCTGLLIETLVPPKRMARGCGQRDRTNPCTSWAVLLRCPIHLARGDGIPLSH